MCGTRELRTLALLGLLAAVLLARFGAAGEAEKDERATEKEARPKDARPAERTTLDEIVVTATRRDLRIFDVPYMVERIDGQYIRERKMAKSTTEIFSDTPSIAPQKTSGGQGSPFLRGFTGYQTLLLIDGIRLNNSVFRSGPNQYWNTIDPFTIGRLEIVKGPSSVLYGSDAVGGTVNAITRSVEEFPDGFNWRRRIVYRYGSADDSSIGRAEISGNYGQKLGFIAGMSLKDFNDLEAGHGTGTQDKTGYGEHSCDLKLDYYPDPDSKLTFAHQHFNQDDAWRAHSTIHGVQWHGTSLGDDYVRAFDQARDLTYVQYQVKNLRSFIDAAKFSLSWHEQQERELRVRSNREITRQGFNCDTFGLSAQFESDTPLGIFTYGGEFYRDFASSFRRDYNPDGSLKQIRIQGPVAADATYDLLGFYVQDQFPITRDLEAIVGLRYSYARADADAVEDPLTGTRVSVADSWQALVGSGRLVYHVGEHWNLFGGVSQGFRAPNFSDLTRLDSARSNEVEIPAFGLSPEKFISYEIGAKANYGRWSGQIALFHTVIEDIIDRVPTGRTIGGKMEVRKANTGPGYVHGIEVEGEYRLSREWSLFGGLACQRGEADTYPTSAPLKERRPMSRILPPTAVVGARWQHTSGRLWFEAVTRMADNQDRLSPGDERDPQRIPPGGTPGYGVLTLRGGVRVTKDLKLNAAIENVLDKDYRIHGSGQNEPGRNFLLSLDWTF